MKRTTGEAAIVAFTRAVTASALDAAAAAGAFVLGAKSGWDENDAQKAARLGCTAETRATCKNFNIIYGTIYGRTYILTVSLKTRQDKTKTRQKTKERL
jgi:mevalonate pyrophosphate decarboxylase